ncbi:MAG: cation transporter [Spirochaetaceae bacterium]|nr:cation transporter [Spirochaetaceae bacterium]
MNKPKKQIRREEQIIKTSIIGIIANIILSAFKLVIGLLSSSIAIMLDALNNLSDALSSIVTIVGMKLALRPADKGHPYGHGRIEYLTGMIISFIVLFAGLTALKESINKIIHPTKATYTTVMLLIIIVAIVVKIILGKYTKTTGERVHSTSLIASGTDALFDSIVSSSTLLSALISIIFKVNLDGIIGSIIAVIIVKAGIQMLLNTLNDILGARIDKEYSQMIKEEIRADENVLGVYDLSLHNYGPEHMVGSVHIAVKEDLKAKDIFAITRALTTKMYLKYGVTLTFGIYAINDRNSDILEMKQKISNYVISIFGIIQIHALYINIEKKEIDFDIVVDFEVKNIKLLKEKLINHIKNEFEGYSVSIMADTDMSD